MRNLTKKQKNYLTNWYNTHKDELHYFDIDYLTTEEYNEVFSMNESEVFWSNANRFVNDLITEAMHSA